ncbi:hypothetical protein HPB52_018123 [Rhipicephalus sanguineus]|uniref:Uncharacterized protein n=1 Tax=Rhipicephalus sanguineus TaxID=34632 RepID=A0A9D4QF30_RHISA|nr:hypothetical protein HPB52_018123 [Rhipicephalus sanguineus]
MTQHYRLAGAAGRPPTCEAPDPWVTLHGVQIPKVASLRVLGSHLHPDGSGAATLPRLQHTIIQLTHLTSEVDKLNVLIRKATKLDMGLPPMASATRRLIMGVHNTWQELVEAQRTSQFERLRLTSTGRSVLPRLGYGERYICEGGPQSEASPKCRVICIPSIIGHDGPLESTRSEDDASTIQTPVTSTRLNTRAKTPTL